LTPIYHITHVENLPQIVKANGLWCDRQRTTQGRAIVSIAHQHIKDRRARRAVPLSVGGTLADYVPFYFAPRSPMLYTIHKGNVAGYDQGQTPIIHLVSSIEAICKARKWAFTEGHADLEYTEFFDDLEHLDRIDWKIMTATYWSNSDEDRRRRQAEFLVHDSCPWSCFHEIGVFDAATAKKVTKILESTKHRPAVDVKKAWYY
jgi:hypothetical protein